jgi:phosphoenolpyruvate carboxykinase (GTP)
MEALLEVDREAWRAEISDIGEYLDSYGARTPAALKAEQERVAGALL